MTPLTWADLPNQQVGRAPLLGWPETDPNPDL